MRHGQRWVTEECALMLSANLPIVLESLFFGGYATCGYATFVDFYSPIRCADD
jgi:hypothetical protein